MILPEIQVSHPIIDEYIKFEEEKLRREKLNANSIYALKKNYQEPKQKSTSAKRELANEEKGQLEFCSQL